MRIRIETEGVRAAVLTTLRPKAPATAVRRSPSPKRGGEMGR